jgi:glutaconate CoA-transferase subunit B
MKMEKRKFKKKLDYLTSPGYLDGPDGRKKAGLPPGGPDKVITDMGVMGFDPDTKQMILLGCFPGITPEQILDHMEFEIRTDQAKEVPVPTETELTLLREKCDPQRLIL